MNSHNPNSYNYTKNKEKAKNETIKVSIRVRPILQHEDVEFWSVDETRNAIATINSTTYNLKYDNSRGESHSMMSTKEKDIKKVLMDSIYSPQSFAFDKIYGQTSNSQMIYKEMCRNITKSVISGYNGTIFMYGQTTSGKTFTMLGTPNSPGILPCALRDIFNLIQKEKNPESFSVFCSYIEIYNENLHDLLTDSNNLKLVDDNKYGVIVSGAKRIKIKSFEDGITLKDFGEENRKYRETLINEYSSRSHTIFQIFVESDYVTDSAEGVRYSCLNLVDLAGSERLNDYDTKTEAFGETGYINKSLFVLANVVNKLAEGKNTYIPYRDSKLTRLISQALGGNSLTAVICTISPAAVNYYQTLSTLRFATRAKIVKTKPQLNEYMDEKGAIEFYKKEVMKLQEELRNKNSTEYKVESRGGNSQVIGNSSNTGNYMHDALPRELLEHIMKTNESLTNELENYKEKYLTEKDKNDKIINEIEKLKTMGAYNQNQNGGSIISAVSISGSNSNSHLPNLKGKTNNFSNFSQSNSSNFGVIQQNENPMSEIQSYKGGYGRIKEENIKSGSNNGEYVQQTNVNEVFHLENIINKSNPYLEKMRNFEIWREEANKINSEYKLDLLSLQNKYRERLSDSLIRIFSNYINTNELASANRIISGGSISHKYLNNMNTNNNPVNEGINHYNPKEVNSSFGSGSENNYQINSNYGGYTNSSNPINVNMNVNTNMNTYEQINDDKDDIIRKIKSASIFNEIRFIFNQNAYENFENNLKNLKQLYEDRVDTLEKNMDYFKSYLENYYRRKIQKTRNNHMDNIDLMNENLPIMSITSEHNEKLKLLRELYDSKLKELEQTFFENLKVITANKMSRA